MENFYSLKLESIHQDIPQCEKVNYLDHAGSSLCPNSIMKKIFENWSKNLYSNPHSQNISSKETRKLINLAREKVKKFFNANDYQVIFTFNATHALKIVGESFPFDPDSTFISFKELHNSALGIREFAYQKGAKIKVFDGDFDQLSTVKGNNLFVFSPECNFSGEKISLDIIKRIKDSNYYLLLDAAKFASTNQMDLSKYTPDFVSISFYKIFGFPSGLGCLLAHNNSVDILKKTYFSGGTVQVSVSDEMYHVLRNPIHEKFEDGTIPFLNIISLLEVLEIPNIYHFTMNDVSKHTFYLANLLYKELLNLKHFNGKNICEFYGNHEYSDISKQGSILNFNFLDEEGNYIGYSQVETLASMENIMLRVGCFCNPGACQTYLKLTSKELKINHKNGHVCWDTKDIINSKPTGSVRVSFGYFSTIENVKKFVEFVKKYFVKLEPKYHQSKSKKSFLSHIYLYPVKSCRGFEVTNWKVNELGLLYDREWTIIDDKGIALKLNKEPKLGLIIPKIQNNNLILSCENLEDLILPLDFYPKDKLDLTVCGTGSQGLIYKSEIVDQWIFKVLGKKCNLIRKDPETTRIIKNNSKINFSNEAPFLMISKSSIDELNKHINSNEKSSEWLIERFRPNFVIEGEDLKPFEEDHYEILILGSIKLQNIGKCNRCSMICIDPKTQKQMNEPLQTLSSLRREKGKIYFGILLGMNIEEKEISIHDKLFL